MKNRNPLPDALWKALSRRILSHSSEIEKDLVQSNAQLIESLQQLGALEEITRKSIFAGAEAAPAQDLAPAPAAKTPSSSAQPEISVRYQTSKSEYRPALKNQTLIDALLEYHQQAHRRKSPVVSSEERAGFAPAKLPQVDAELKAESARQPRPASSLPILRSKLPKG